jgi:hypothetical protein
VPVAEPVFRSLRMAQPYPTTPQMPATRRTAQAIVMGGAGIGVAALLAALGLWFHYGTAVFFETIAAGLAACF